MDNIENDNQFNTHQSSIYPPKPMVVNQQKNSTMRSLMSLLLYGVMFYFLFEPNPSLIAALLLVIIIHELGHFALMKIFNYSNVKIFFIPLLGAYTSGKKQQISQAQLAAVILAGPIPGIIIGLILFYMNQNLQNDIVKMLANIFLFLNLFNLLPFMPLDGGRLLETLFVRENFVLRMVFGIISIICLLALSLLSLNFIMLIIPAFIAMDLFNEYKNNKIREYLKQEKINYFTDYENLPDKDYWIIRDCLLFSNPKKFIGIQPGRYDYSIIEPLIIQQVTSILKINVKLNLKPIAVVAIIVFYALSIALPLVYVLSVVEKLFP
ncbi:MAG: hypothetical protein JSU07_14215 [Bacteroidetes bacterium]|nr:hypothetical protein [Bacteroidota bacterium]